MQNEEVTIINKLGLHARAAAKLVTLASSFSSNVHLKNGTQQVNGKSIMGVLMLAAARGTKLEIEAEGNDESEAIRQLVELVENRFDEDE